MANQIERNKAAATAFYEAALNRKDAEAALTYLGQDYRQHNPVIEDGRAGLAKMLNSLAATYPLTYSDILRVITERGRILFSEMFESATSRSEIVCTFLALLELIRLKQLICAQTEEFAEIEVKRALTFTETAVATSPTVPVESP